MHAPNRFLYFDDSSIVLEAVTVLAQQKATAHRSHEASLVLVPATITFWIRPVTCPVRAAVVVTSLALRHLVV